MTINERGLRIKSESPRVGKNMYMRRAGKDLKPAEARQSTPHQEWCHPWPIEAGLRKKRCAYMSDVYMNVVRCRPTPPNTDLRNYIHEHSHHAIAMLSRETVGPILEQFH